MQILNFLWRRYEEVGSQKVVRQWPRKKKLINRVNSAKRVDAYQNNDVFLDEFAGQWDSGDHAASMACCCKRIS
jgi:hypothetical protein